MNHKKQSKRKLKVLLVTPEITYVPAGMGDIAHKLSAKAGGMADVSASLVAALYQRGVDVHVALPHYRRLFHIEVADLLDAKLEKYQQSLHADNDGETRVHLAEDRTFYYRNQVYPSYAAESLNMSLVFQREVINNIIPQVKPDLIHCNDWMTGLIPGYARRLNIPTLLTVHNIHTQDTTLATVEDHGIDTALFWQDLYFKRQPINYEESRENNLIDLLTSGIFGAHFINTVSPTFLHEIVDGRHPFIAPQIQREMSNKYHAGCAKGILNAPDPDYMPETDQALVANYGPTAQAEKKRANKVEFQRRTGLIVNPDAPLFFWPSRLDPIQKGPQLLAQIMYSIIHDYWPRMLQVGIVGNGPYFQVFKDIVAMHGFQDRICVMPFQEDLSRLGYAGSDFILMPSSFEPCGLPQMIGPLYGSLPIVFNTGGLHDTVQHLDISKNSGNGFVFDYHDAQGLRWAIDQAMQFNSLIAPVKNAQIERIMQHARETFNNDRTADEYVKIYQQMLQRPLLQYMHREEPPKSAAARAKHS
ncbi:MAG: glycogen/starch synthase [Victivallales bacterium]|nr:glycogen/starch synthase [Victivallales bacterium]